MLCITRFALLSFVSALALALAPLAADAAADQGTVIFTNRLRSETVDQDGFSSNANALTLRTQLGWQSPKAGDFSFLIEGEAVTAFQSDYNSTVNGKASFPVIADPEGSRINRLQVIWTGAPKTQVVLGRQILVLDNARFIGDSAFRQTEQTFDGLKIATTAIPGVTLTYAIANRVNRVFGEKSIQGHWDGSVQVVNGSGKTAIGTLSVYDYLLDFDNAPTQSSATLGGRLTGEHPAGKGAAVTYGAEWARQTDHGRNPGHFALDYTSFSLGVKTSTLAVSLNREQLGSDGTFAFQTPLATLHPFQGWADVFLATPVQGLSDTFAAGNWTVTLKGPVQSLKATVAWHDFRSTRGKFHYGSEWDLGVSVPLTKKVSASVQMADFSGALPAMKSRTKIWLALDYSY